MNTLFYIQPCMIFCVHNDAVTATAVYINLLWIVYSVSDPHGAKMTFMSFPLPLRPWNSRGGWNISMGKTNWWKMGPCPTLNWPFLP